MTILRIVRLQQILLNNIQTVILCLMLTMKRVFDSMLILFQLRVLLLVVHIFLAEHYQFVWANFLFVVFWFF